jgi:hypothetical protein
VPALQQRATQEEARIQAAVEEFEKRAGESTKGLSYLAGRRNAYSDAVRILRSQSSTEVETVVCSHCFKRLPLGCAAHNATDDAICGACLVDKPLLALPAPSTSEGDK